MAPAGDGLVDISGARRLRMTTRDQNPDASFFEMLSRLPAAFDESGPLNEKAVALRRAGRLEEAAEFDALCDESFAAACAMELEIALTEVAMPEAFIARCKLIEEANFDPPDLMILAYLLGQNAERLELDYVPGFLTAGPRLAPEEILNYVRE